MNFKKLLQLCSEAFKEWQRDRVSRLAAALAYYTVFSLAPLLSIAIAIAGAVLGEEAARGQIVELTRGTIGQDGAEIIQTAIQNANQSQAGGLASIVSIVILLFGASGVFAQIQEALNTVWNVRVKPGSGIKEIIRKRLLSFSMVFAIGFLLIVSLILSTLISFLGQAASDILPGVDFLWGLLNFVVSLIVIAVLFAIAYKYIPDVEVAWKDVTIGAIVTSILFAIGKWVLGLYLGRSGFASAYGAAGSIVIILAWVYYTAQILFYGAELTQVYARKYGSGIVPNRHAERVPSIDDRRSTNNEQ